VKKKKNLRLKLSEMKYPPRFQIQCHQCQCLVDCPLSAQTLARPQMIHIFHRQFVCLVSNYSVQSHSANIIVKYLLFFKNKYKNVLNIIVPN